MCKAAVSKKIRAEFGDFSTFLSRLNRDGGGFLFRHGWVVQVLLGLLKGVLERRPDLKVRRRASGERARERFS